MDNNPPLNSEVSGMEKLLTSVCKCNLQSVPDSYVLPPDSRPGDIVFSKLKGIPIIDLGKEKLSQDRTRIIQQIIEASQEFGFFQLVNHGVSERLMEDVLEVSRELFELPDEDKAKLYSEDLNQSCRLYTSIEYGNEKVHYWRDAFRHPCHPLEEHVQSWPQNPARYQEVIGQFAVEVRKLSMWLLDAISQGLGLDLNFFRNQRLTQFQLMGLSAYPPCPDPTLTLGLPKHCDVNLITLLLQGHFDHPGLQVFKDDQWLVVDPLPNAFVVNIGHMLQIISNGKLTSAAHRVVTSKSDARVTVASFIHPDSDTHIEPARALVNDRNPPRFKDFVYKDFRTAFMADTYNRVPPLERYKLC